MKDALKILDNNIYPKSLIFCEPFMSKRGLYPTMSKKLTSVSQKAYEFYSIL